MSDYIEKNSLREVAGNNLGKGRSKGSRDKNINNEVQIALSPVFGITKKI